MRDPRSGRVFASVTSPFYGPKIWYADDPAASGSRPRASSCPSGGDAALERIWVIVPGEDDGTVYAGGDPGVLFESRDGGATFSSTARSGSTRRGRGGSRAPAGCACTRSCRGRASRTGSRSAISAAGVWLTDDGGASWRRGNEGLVARYLPEDAPADEVALCVHRLRARAGAAGADVHAVPRRRLPLRRRGRDVDDIAAGLPSDFGFPLALDPADPDSAYVIPLVADIDRVTPDGRVRVYETRDAGASWTPRGDGLPVRGRVPHRAARGVRPGRRGPSLELYFGATSGAVYGSGDAGATLVRGGGAPAAGPLGQRVLTPRPLAQRDLDA